MDLTQKFLLQSSILLEKYSCISSQLRAKCFNECEDGVLVDKTVACKWCYNSWAGGKISVKVEPQKKKKIKKTSTHPKRYNVLNIKCLVCLKRTKVILAKEAKEKKIPPANIVEDEPTKVKKKKKKKKDQFAGLNPSVFEDVSQSKPIQPLITPKIKPPQTQPLSNLSLLQTITKKAKKKRTRHKNKKGSCVSSFINDC